MSLEALEHAIYDLGIDRNRRKLFQDDPEAFLAGYALSPEEADMIRRFDVRAMQAAGLNPMLSMGFWMTSAPDRSLKAYSAALKQESARG